MALRLFGDRTYGDEVYGELMGFNTLGPSARRLYHDLWRDPHLQGLWLMNEGTSAIYDHALGSRNNLTMVSSPTYGATAAPGFPGVTLTAANKHYATGGQVNDFTSAAERSALAVLTMNSRPSAAAIMGKYNNNQGWVWALQASGQQQVLMGAGGASTIWRISCTTNATGTPVMMGFSFSPLNAGTGTVAEPEDFTFYTNGVGSTVGANGASGAVGVTTSTNDFAIGAAVNSANSTFCADMTIGFVALFSAQKTAADFARWARLGGFR